MYPESVLDAGYQRACSGMRIANWCATSATCLLGKQTAHPSGVLLFGLCHWFERRTRIPNLIYCSSSTHSYCVDIRQKSSSAFRSRWIKYAIESARMYLVVIDFEIIQRLRIDSRCDGTLLHFFLASGTSKRWLHSTIRERNHQHIIQKLASLAATSLSNRCRSPASFHHLSCRLSTSHPPHHVGARQSPATRCDTVVIVTVRPPISD